MLPALRHLKQRALHGPYLRQVKSLDLPYRPVLPHDWPAHDAWLKPGLDIAFAIPTSTPSCYCCDGS